MRRSIVGVLVLAVLVSAAPAAAKGVSSATVCGRSECREVKDPATTAFLSEGGDPTDPPSTAAPWYRATLRFGEPGAVVGEGGLEPRTVTVVPDHHLLLGADGTWMVTSRFAADAYRKVMIDVEPFPASSMPGIAKAPADAGGPSGSDGGSPAWILVAGALSLLALTGAVVRRRVATGTA
jgi:hypothetical protein